MTQLQHEQSLFSVWHRIYSKAGSCVSVQCFQLWYFSLVIFRYRYIKEHCHRGGSGCEQSEGTMLNPGLCRQINTLLLNLSFSGNYKSRIKLELGKIMKLMEKPTCFWQSSTASSVSHLMSCSQFWLQFWVLHVLYIGIMNFYILMLYFYSPCTWKYR